MWTVASASSSARGRFKMTVPRRNDPCPCASGKKYKRCCMEKDRRATRNQKSVVSPSETASQIDEFIAAFALMQETMSDANAQTDELKNGRAANVVPWLESANRLQSAAQQMRMVKFDGLLEPAHVDARKLIASVERTVELMLDVAAAVSAGEALMAVGNLDLMHQEDETMGRIIDRLAITIRWIAQQFEAAPED